MYTRLLQNEVNILIIPVIKQSSVQLTLVAEMNDLIDVDVNNTELSDENGIFVHIPINKFLCVLCINMLL